MPSLDRMFASGFHVCMPIVYLKWLPLVTYQLRTRHSITWHGVQLANVETGMLVERPNHLVERHQLFSQSGEDFMAFVVIEPTVWRIGLPVDLINCMMNRPLLDVFYENASTRHLSIWRLQVSTRLHVVPTLQVVIYSVDSTAQVGGIMQSALSAYTKTFERVPPN